MGSREVFFLENSVYTLYNCKESPEHARSPWERSAHTPPHKTSKKKQKQKTKASPPPFFAVLFSPSLRLSSALLQQELIDEGGPGLDDAPDGRSNEPEHSLLQGVQHGPHKRDVLDEAAHGPVVLVLYHSTLQ